MLGIYLTRVFNTFPSLFFSLKRLGGIRVVDWIPTNSKKGGAILRLNETRGSIEVRSRFV